MSYSGGTPTLDDSFNVTSIGDTAVGKLTVTIATDFANDDYSVYGSCDRDGGTNTCSTGHYAAEVGTVVMHFSAGGDGSDIDPAEATFAISGDR